MCGQCLLGHCWNENITEECLTYGFPEEGSLQVAVGGSGVRFTASHGVYSLVCPTCDDKGGCVHRSTRPTSCQAGRTVSILEGLSSGRTLSPKRILSSGRILCPLRGFSIPWEDSLNPERTLSPGRTLSPARILSPRRILCPLGGALCP